MKGLVVVEDSGWNEIPRSSHWLMGHDTFRKLREQHKNIVAIWAGDPRRTRIMAQCHDLSNWDMEPDWGGMLLFAEDEGDGRAVSIRRLNVGSWRIVVLATSEAFWIGMVLKLRDNFA